MIKRKTREKLVGPAGLRYCLPKYAVEMLTLLFVALLLAFRKEGQVKRQSRKA